MNLSILYLFTLSILVQVNNITYQNTEKDYSIIIPKSTEVKRMDIKSTNMYIDKFTFRKEGETAIDYIVGITKVSNIGTDELKLNEAYILGFLNTCKCEVIESKETKYLHFKGIQFKTKTPKASGGYSYGYTIQLKKNEHMFSIIYYASEANFSRYESTFFETVESFNPIK